MDKIARGGYCLTTDEDVVVLRTPQTDLPDYKVWCFDGEPVYIQYISGRDSDKTMECFYDLNWNIQNFSYHNPMCKNAVRKPKCLEKLIQVARTLATGVPFARVDFYVLEDGTIRFGEITFYPMSGFEKMEAGGNGYHIRGIN